MSSVGFKVEFMSSGLSIEGLGFLVHCWGSRGSQESFRADGQGLGFKVSGSGFRV